MQRDDPNCGKLALPYCYLKLRIANNPWKADMHIRAYSRMHTDVCTPLHAQLQT